MPGHSSDFQTSPCGGSSKGGERDGDGANTFRMPQWDLREDVVISGISGRFPESDSIEELKKNLYEGIDMITENDRRWKPGLFGTPKRMGKLKEIVKFDALFFGVHGKQAEVMDPMHRLLLESSYEAIFDSGYDPGSLRGRSIGVFVGCSDKSVSGDAVPEDMLTGYELLGMSTALLANRVSFSFGFTGPSMSIDTACSSTLHALNEAVLAIKNNRCDAAIVGGGTISLSASQTISFSRLGLLSKEGTCKVFDATANGYVRSEAVGAIFIQKASDARRLYATIMHCKLNNDGAKVEGISFPSAKQQQQLFKEVFSELDLNPAEISYVEAHGTGTVAGDREESNAIAEFFCPGRTTPLLVGSVKSNLGHAEAASGICTLAKIILSMEEGVIPPNIHYKEPNPHVPALLEGTMKVIAEKTPWKPGMVATNNFGFGGSNAHIVLRANQTKPRNRKERIIPRLTLVCGRTEESVLHIFRRIQEDHFTDEALVLLEEACKAPTVGMKYRGYAMVQEPGKELSPVVEKSPVDSRPVWFLFSGMGSQWSTMAKELMIMDIFAESIGKSAEVLKPYGVDLIHLLTQATEEELNNIVAPFVTIAAVQIALVDMIKLLGIEPDGIIGHSVGELGCAYADGCFTAKQMLLAAFWRGNSCAKTKLINGLMAAVGLTWEETKKRCPEGVYPVCHNAEDSVTISGPAEMVKKFVQELTADNVFARIVKTCDIAFHSKYVEPASHLMRRELSKVIPNPLPRSSRWVSSSVPEEKWNEPEAQLSSVDYHVNNLLSPVLFNEAMAKVPKNALIIEFAPHSLLQAIVKRILGPESIYIGLMKRGHQDNILHCLEAIGKMYTSNLTPSVKNLYEPVQFPVPRGTAMLNSIIKWDHFNSLQTWNYEAFLMCKDDVYVDTFRGCTEEFMLGHKVDGRILFPFMGYVWLAWKALAKIKFMEVNELPVVIEDFSVFRASILPKTGKWIFRMKILDCDGNFRIVEGSTVVASGRILEGGDKVLKMKDHNMYQSSVVSEESFTLDAKDFYKELRLRGYEYGPTFQGVISADSTGHKGRIKWEGRWVSFMDAMLQIPILCVPMRMLLLPTRVKSIRIDPRLKPEDNEEGVPFSFNPHIKVCRAGPVEIQGMHCGVAPRRKDHESVPILEHQLFVPLFDSRLLEERERDILEEYSHVCSTLAHRILQESKFKDKSDSSTFIDGFFEEAPRELTESYLSSAAEVKSHALLRVLKEVQESESEEGLRIKVQSALDNHRAEMFHDLLTNAIMTEKGLRAALDVVQDNHFSSKMKVLEVSVNSFASKDVLRMLGMTTLGLVKYDYIVARVNEDPIPDAVLEASIKTLNCDFSLKSLPGDNELIVAKDLFTDSDIVLKDTLCALSSSLKSKGFLLLVERTVLSPAEKFLAVMTESVKSEQKEQTLEEAFEKAGLTMVCKKKDRATSVLYLLRKLPNAEKEPDRPSRLIRIPSRRSDHSWVEELKTALKECEGKLLDKVWLVDEGQDSGLVGLINCLKQEPEGSHLRYFLNAKMPNETLIPAFDFGERFFHNMLKSDLVMNIFRDGQWGNFSHRILEKDPPRSLRTLALLNITKIGDLSSFRWLESGLAQPPSGTQDKEQVSVYYSAINFRDIMLASGKLPPDATPIHLAIQNCLLGFEFVGRDSDGRRVMGIIPSRGMATVVSVDRQNLIPVPDHWTMEEACTVPVVYMTSYYALIIRGQLQRGQSVLIHSGTGGVGQAAISICLSMECQVFVTVGSEEKRSVLKKTFPEIEDSHISTSRDVEFEYDVMNATGGKGVDLVLNSLADDKLQASVRCLRQHGRFLEIGKYDIAMNSNLGMSMFQKNVTFHGVHLDSLIEKSGSVTEVFLQIERLVSEGIKTGVVRPLKANVFCWDKAEEAFRFMASGKHVGKVVLKIREEEPERVRNPVDLEIPCTLRTYCSPDKSYVITGGLGGFGLELAGWLVDRGAKNLVLSSRTQVKNEYQRLWIHRWTQAGVRVQVSNGDISTADGTEDLLREADLMAPIGGIFHLAMVLHDGLFENLKPEDFAEVSKSKVEGILHLDQQSKKLCPQLDHFVVFSSISCGRGNPGQSNYGYANSVMERVVERRKHEGLPGLAVQWGGIGDVGVVYEKMGGNDVILKGTVPQRLGSCLEVLDRFMQEDHAIVSSFVPVEKAAFRAESGEDVVTLLCKVLGIGDPTSVKKEMTLGELGMDSLMGVEIKQVLETDYDTVLTVPEVRQLSIKDLEEIGQKKCSGSVREAPPQVLSTGIIFVGEKFVPTEILSPLNDLRGTHCVFFVHPLEGHTNMLKALASNVKKPVYGLQYTQDVPCGTTQAMAACYIQHVKTVQPHGPYHLVGYSYGCMVAFEMALQLQKTDQVKTFICIDGSPAAVVEACACFITEEKKAEISFTTAPILMFMKNYMKNVPSHIEDAVRNLPPGDVISQARGLVEHMLAEKVDEPMWTNVCERLYDLAWAAKLYIPGGLFRGRVTLVRSNQDQDDIQLKVILKDDYHLSEVVDGSVEVFSLNVPHKVIADDLSNEVSKIINDRV